MAGMIDENDARSLLWCFSSRVSGLSTPKNARIHAHVVVVVVVVSLSLSLSLSLSVDRSFFSRTKHTLEELLKGMRRVVAKTAPTPAPERQTKRVRRCACAVLRWPRPAAAAALQVFTMSVSDRRAVIGTSNRHIWVYDMRSLSEPEQRRLSSLKFQTRCVRVFPNQEGYAVGSVEGRVAVEYFDTSKVL